MNRIQRMNFLAALIIAALGRDNVDLEEVKERVNSAYEARESYYMGCTKVDHDSILLSLSLDIMYLSKGDWSAHVSDVGIVNLSALFDKKR
jgi:hypothetical protein